MSVVRTSDCVSGNDDDNDDGLTSWGPFSALELSTSFNYFIMQMRHHYLISEAANHRG